jgi:hypothetical protein
MGVGIGSSVTASVVPLIAGAEGNALTAIHAIRAPASKKTIKISIPFFISTFLFFGKFVISWIPS